MARGPSVLLAWLAATASGALLQIPLLDDGADAALASSRGISRLKTIFGERLVDAHPIGKPCYSQPDARNETACDMVTCLTTVDTYISSQPGGYFYGNWASCQAEREQNCALPLKDKTKPVDPSRKCHQGAVPDQMVAVATPEDVQTIFAEAATHSTPPLVIKNTGHDWKGRSTGPGALAIWTRHWPNEMKLEKNFKPLNCGKQLSNDTATISFGPGATWGDVYEFANKQDLSVVGGTCKTVGVAGWLHGGGHSPLTPVYGMGVDNVRQIEIVTPDGKRQIANECINDDLFFAVRGGGGGTWGVVTRIWYRTWPKIKVIELSASLGNRTWDEKDNFTSIVTRNALKWSTQGWGGYLKPTEPRDSIELVNSLKGVGLDQAKTQMKELLGFLKDHNITHKFEPRGSWYDYIKDHMAPTDHHIGSWSLVPAGRLLPPEVFANTTRLAKSLSDFYKPNITLWLMMVTPTMFNHTTKSALHPSWKTAIMSARANTKWDLYDNQDSYAQIKYMNTSFQAIRQLAPGSGVSMSETHIWEPDHHLAFWGQKNYDRLRHIKLKIDPNNMLSVWHGVGFKTEDPRFKCYPKN